MGAHASGEIGEDPNGIPDNLVPFVCQVAKGKLEKLQVFGSDYPTLTERLSEIIFTLVDLADAHVRSLKLLSGRDEGFTCNLGTGRGSSVMEVIAAFERVTGKTIPYELVGRRAGDVTEAWAEPSLARELLGWESKRSLEEMLADAWRWQEKIRTDTVRFRVGRILWGQAVFPAKPSIPLQGRVGHRFLFPWSEIHSS